MGVQAWEYRYGSIGMAVKVFESKIMSKPSFP